MCHRKLDNRRKCKNKFVNSQIVNKKDIDNLIKKDVKQILHKSTSKKHKSSTLVCFLLIMFMWIIVFVAANLAINAIIDSIGMNSYDSTFTLYCADGLITSFTFFLPIYYPKLSYEIRNHSWGTYIWGAIATVILSISPLLIIIIIYMMKFIIKLFVWLV